LAEKVFEDGSFPGPLADLGRSERNGRCPAGAQSVQQVPRLGPLYHFQSACGAVSPAPAFHEPEDVHRGRVDRALVAEVAGAPRLAREARPHPFDRAQRLLEVSQGAGEISSRHGGPAQALAGRPEPFRRAALLGRPKALPEGLLRFREAPARNEETTEIEEILDLLRAVAALPGQA